jgi:hypothetical protein
VLTVVLDDDDDSLGNVVRVQDGIPRQRLLRLHLRHDLVVSGRGEFVEGLVRCVVLQDIEDEAFFYSLSHRVEVERHRRALGTRPPEELHGLRLGRGREREVADVGRPLPREHDLVDDVLGGHVLGVDFDVGRHLHGLTIKLDGQDRLGLLRDGSILRQCLAQLLCS